MRQKVTLSLNPELLQQFKELQSNTGLSLSGFVDAQMKKVISKKKFYVFTDPKAFIMKNRIFDTVEDAIKKAEKIENGFVGVVKGNLIWMR